MLSWDYQASFSTMPELLPGWYSHGDLSVPSRHSDTISHMASILKLLILAFKYMTLLSLIGLQSQDQQFSQYLPLWNLHFPSYVPPAPVYDTSLLDPRRLFWSQARGQQLCFSQTRRWVAGQVLWVLVTTFFTLLEGMFHRHANWQFPSLDAIDSLELMILYCEKVSSAL